jgi:hypothetical protein
VAIVHNGRIHDYDILKQRYDVRGECDSELILSMYMSGFNYKDNKEFLEKNMPGFGPDLAYRAVGMMEIFKYIDMAALAVAIGDRGDNGERILWLHRNSERPINFVDLRETLGQVFYFSTVEIWKSAISTLGDAANKEFIPMPHKIAIFPVDEMWLWKINPSEGKDNWTWDRYKILRTKVREYSEVDLPKTKIKAPVKKNSFNVNTRLGADDKIIDEKYEDTELEIPNAEILGTSTIENKVEVPVTSTAIVPTALEDQKKKTD